MLKYTELTWTIKTLTLVTDLDQGGLKLSVACINVIIIIPSPPP